MIQQLPNWAAAIVPLIVAIGAGLILFGKLKEAINHIKEDLKMIESTVSQCVKQRDCMSHINGCHSTVQKNFDDLKSEIRDVKKLVIDLHSETTKKIKEMDDKRENAKDSYFKTMIELNKNISQLDAKISKAEKG